MPNAWCGLLRCKSARKNVESRHKSWTKLTWVVSAGQRKFIWSSQINQLRFFTDRPPEKRPRVIHVKHNVNEAWVVNDRSFACHELEASFFSLFAHCCPESEISSTCLNILCPHVGRKKTKRVRWPPSPSWLKPAVRFQTTPPPQPPTHYEMDFPQNGSPKKQRR